MENWKKTIVITVWLLAASQPLIAAGITAIGPVSGPLGYPQWIQDSQGITLGLCTHPTPFCTGPIGGEAFYWVATADAPALVPAGNCRLVLAWEASYSGAGEIVNGSQIIFARLRILINVPAAGTYIVTHPYGQITFNNVTVADGINYTEDIGAIHPVLVEEAFQGILAATAAPALVWPDYLDNPSLFDPISGHRFVGDNATPHVVTGSPTGDNFFRVEGPGGIVSETPFFVVMGELFDGEAPTPWTFPASPPQNLAAVGPVNRQTPFNPGSIAAVTGTIVPNYPVGFPMWYQDAAAGGLQLTIIPGGDPMGISMPVTPTNPNSVALSAGDESFFWSAEAGAIGDGINGLLVMGVEGAFGGVGTAMEGQQIVFTRLRLRIDAPVAGDYTVTYPFGTKTFTDIPAGRRTINFTEDLGGANPLDPDSAMAGALYGNISRFLTWPDYAADPLLTAITATTGNVYIGNPAVPHVVTGSPTGNNFFRIEGPGALVAQTDLFLVSGKVFNPDTIGLPNSDAPIINTLTAVPNLILDNQTCQLAVDAVDPDAAPAPLSFNWSVPPGSGSVSDPAIANPVYTPPTVTATQTVTLTAEVSDGLTTVSGTVAITVTPFVIPVTTLPPTAADDAVTTPADTAAAIDVLANDTAEVPAAIDPASTAIGVFPVNGTVLLNPLTGQVTYVPAPGYSGADSFTYTVHDSVGLISNIATVNITVTPPPVLPPAAVDDTAVTAADTAVVINIVANDTATAPGTIDPASAAIVAFPANGTVLLNPLTGQVTYVPAPGYSGADSFTYTVHDSVGLISNVATVNITVTPLPALPPAAADDTAVTAADTAVVINILANDTATAPGTINPASAAIVAFPANGTVLLNPLNGRVTYTPATGFSGTDSFAYTVRDSAAQISNIAAVTVTVNPPVVQEVDVYEAEHADMSGPTVSTAVGGFTGTGFADFLNARNDFVEWTVNSATAGQYLLEFRYALGGSSRSLSISVNGAVVTAACKFPSTGSFANWNTLSTAATLQAGANTIRVTAIGSSGPNIDSLRIVPLAPGFVYEAENASLNGGAILSTVVPGYTGLGFVDYVAKRGESVEWTIEAPTAGQYQLGFRYSLGGGSRSLSIAVNGTEVNPSLDFLSTGDWTTWETLTATATLNAGVNTIRATSIDTSGPNLDNLIVIGL